MLGAVLQVRVTPRPDGAAMAYPPRVGTRLIAGRYALDVPEVPGRVWRARDAITGGAVLVTVLPEGPTADAALHALATVRHPSLPVVLDHGVDGDRYVVTPERSARSARARLTHGLRGPELAAFGLPLAEALDQLHRYGLVQGRLDLDSIVLDAQGPARIEDVAVAGLAEPAGRPEHDVQALAALLCDAARVAPGANLLDEPGFSPRFAAMLQAMASPLPPDAARVAAGLRAVADADHVPAPSATAPAASGRRRPLKVAVGLLAVAVLVLAAIAVVGLVDDRDRVDEGIPGAITTVVPADLPTESITLPTVAATEAEADPTAATETEAEPAAAPRPRQQRLSVATVTAVDPGGDNAENSADARRTIDRSPASVWSSEVYKDADFGGKDGIGLELSLTVPSRVTRVIIASLPPGSEVTIYAVRGAVPARPPVGWKQASATVTLRRARAVVPVVRRAPATALLVWITGVPCTGGGCAISVRDIRVVGQPRGA